MKYGDLKECRNCHSNNIQIVKYIIANGKIQYRYQCMDCGCLDGSSIKYASIPQNIDIPLVNEKLRDCYYDNTAKQFENFLIIDYDEYIKSDEWRQKRPKILALKGNKCAICGNYYGLDIHHLNYDSLGYEENNNFADVIPLCRGCHRKIHDILDKNEDNLKTLKADLLNLRNYYFFHYHEAINEIVYEYTKDLKWHNRTAIKIYLETLYGKYKCNNSIAPYFDSGKVLNKIKGDNE